jgi:hypothetical protein
VVFQFSRVAGYTPADCRKLAAQTVNRIFAARHMCAARPLKANLLSLRTP